MRLRSVRIKNFLSFGEEAQEFRFSEGSPISLVVGPNNSGKSNLFRTLSFVAEAIGSSYPPLIPDSYLPSKNRDFEIIVKTELNEAELEALQHSSSLRPGLPIYPVSRRVTL